MPGTKVVNGKVVPDLATYPGGRAPSPNAGSQDVAKVVGKEMDKRIGPGGGGAGRKRVGGLASAATPRVGRPQGSRGGKGGPVGVRRRTPAGASRGVAPKISDPSKPATTGPAMGGRDPRFAGGTNVTSRPPIPATPSAQSGRAALPSAPGQMPPGASAGGGAADIARMINAARTPMPGVRPPGIRRPAVGGPLGQKMMPPRPA
jgi:hypothetical protein